MALQSYQQTICCCCYNFVCRMLLLLYISSSTGKPEDLIKLASPAFVSGTARFTVQVFYSSQKAKVQDLQVSQSNHSFLHHVLSNLKYLSAQPHSGTSSSCGYSLTVVPQTSHSAAVGTGCHTGDLVRGVRSITACFMNHYKILGEGESRSST
jgi:hypothetical protein